MATTSKNSNAPQGPAPAWLETFRRDIRAVLAGADADTGPDFDPPEGESVNDQPPEHVQAVFLKTPAGDGI